MLNNKYCSVNDAHTRRRDDPDDFWAALDPIEMSPEHIEHIPHTPHIRQMFAPRARARRIQIAPNILALQRHVSPPVKSADRQVVIGSSVALCFVLFVFIGCITWHAPDHMEKLLVASEHAQLVSSTDSRVTMLLHPSSEYGAAQTVVLRDQSGQRRWRVNIIARHYTTVLDLRNTNCFNVSTNHVNHISEHEVVYFNASSYQVSVVHVKPSTPFAHCTPGLKRRFSVRIPNQTTPTFNRVGFVQTSLDLFHAIPYPLNTVALGVALAEADVKIKKWTTVRSESWWHSWCIHTAPTLSLACARLHASIGNDALRPYSCQNMSVALAHVANGNTNKCGHCNEYDLSGCQCWASLSTVAARLSRQSCRHDMSKCVYPKIDIPCVSKTVCKEGWIYHATPQISMCTLAPTGPCIGIYPTYNLFAGKHRQEAYLL
jgi:hypothetical protein